MKTDENYIYPETPEELAMFYGWECEVHRQGQDIWVTYEELIGTKALSTVGPFPCKYRLPLPTLSDLKHDDVVKYKVYSTDNKSHYEEWSFLKICLRQKEEHSHNYDFSDIQFLIGRNTWVPVKCN